MRGGGKKEVGKSPKQANQEDKGRDTSVRDEGSRYIVRKRWSI